MSRSSAKATVAHLESFKNLARWLFTIKFQRIGPETDPWGYPLIVVEINGFDPQFNAITGNNGSGKSNILDSICFVLGIQNLQQMLDEHICPQLEKLKEERKEYTKYTKVVREHEHLSKIYTAWDYSKTEEKTSLAQKQKELTNSLKKLENLQAICDKDNEAVTAAENHFHAVNAGVGDDGEEASLAAQIIAAGKDKKTAETEAKQLEMSIKHTKAEIAKKEAENKKVDASYTKDQAMLQSLNNEVKKLQLYNIIVDDEEVGKLILSKGQLMRRCTIIPLNKVMPKVIENRMLQEAENLVGKNNVAVALSRINYPKHVAPAMEYTFGDVFICPSMDAAQIVTFAENIRKKSVTLAGEQFDPAGTLSGGSINNKPSILAEIAHIPKLKKAVEEKQQQLNSLHIEIQNIRRLKQRYDEMCQQYELKENEAGMLKYKIEHCTFHKQLEEIQKMKQSLEEQINNLSMSKEKQKSAEKLLKELEVKSSKSTRESKVKEAETAVAECRKKARASMEKLNAFQADIVASLSEELKKQKGVLKSHSSEIGKINKEKEAMSKKIASTELQMQQLEHDIKNCGDNCAEANKKDFGSIFRTLLPGSQAKLVPQPGKTVLEGLEFKVAFGDIWKESLNELSGGQRSLVALSLILALLLFSPAPIYILDEVDSALDLSHTQNIGKMLKMHFKASQGAPYIISGFNCSGFPTIIATRTPWRKVVKIIVFVGCTCGFLYQTSEFLELYWAYPTMVDIKVENPDSVVLPAISFCNANRNYVSVSWVDNDGYPFNCFTVETLWGQPDEEQINIPLEGKVSMLLNLQPEEYTLYYDLVLVHIGLHEAHGLGNPFREGIKLQAGRTYDIFVNQACTEKCKMESMIETEGCAAQTISYPEEYSICPDGEFKFERTFGVYPSDAIVEKCSQQCNEACNYHEKVFL
ncbi:Structural maintenance of chromosomes protein like [Argiope bruennichi]|uniref:Structural maintenance of chromosomes protein like n=1 Tax=Argiope bruennichi TaxID=94029 RepID=A0A8T0ETE8_ARGBR|nr:Structural maintenance of chromosomes protein like [Argiope bruennichi]